MGSTPPRLVFLGTRDWPPNQEAFERAVALWPRIADGIPGAELCVVGGRSASAAPVELPPGVRDLGFVDDLHGFLATCRGMVAPISTGGGVRVKFLDAARIGLPVVGTRAAVGSLDEVYGLDTCADDEAVVAAARRLLTDVDAASPTGGDCTTSPRGDGESGVRTRRWRRCSATPWPRAADPTGRRVLEAA